MTDLLDDRPGEQPDDVARWDPRWTGELVVDLDAIAANTAAIAARVAPAAVMAVVKADAYGHGLLPAARAALAGGATWLGVAQVGEALALRAGGVRERVLAWLWAPGQDLDAAVAAGVDLSASSAGGVEELAAAARRAGTPARAHLEVDTGMARGGATAADWPDVVRAALDARSEGHLELVAAWSHLACADVPGDPSVERQRLALVRAVEVAEGLGARFELRQKAK